MRAILAAGGTAGHINPAVAIAKKIAADGGEVLFIGNENGMEFELVPKEGFKIEGIKVSGFKRSLSPKNIKTAWQAMRGIAKTKKIIRDFKPDIVIGCGGYVSGPAVYSASMMKIPTLIHEQNAFPGMTTKILSRVVNKICVSFEDSIKYIGHKEKIIVTGNPLRENILAVTYDEARERLGLTKPTVLVFGGSLGAKKINDTMTDMIPALGNDIEIIWGTGKRYFDEITEKLKSAEISENIKIVPYIYNMDEVMSGADIVVSRAGAITLGEICAKGKAAVLIPSPYVTHNHQEYNARALEKKGAAIIIGENDLSAPLLKKTLLELAADKGRLERMQKNALSLSRADAADVIYAEICKLTHKH